MIETDVQIASIFPDQFLPAVNPGHRKPVEVENGPIVINHKEGVTRVIHEGAEARLARAQLLLRVSQFGDVLQDAEVA
jgi:hypothetical protein